MAFEFLSSLDTTTAFLLLFIFSMKKVFSVLMNLVVIGAVSLLFPVVMNRFFGFDIPIDSDSLISFVLLGIGVYFVYLVAKSLYKVLGIAERAGKKYMPERKQKREEPEREPEERAGNKYKEMEKELKGREKELAKKEHEIQWKSKLQRSGDAARPAAQNKRKDWTKEYASLEEAKRPEKEVKTRPAIIEPLPVIEHKKKKKGKK